MLTPAGSGGIRAVGQTHNRWPKRMGWKFSIQARTQSRSSTGQPAFRQDGRVQAPPQLPLDHFDIGLGIEQPGDAGMDPQRGFAGRRLQHRLIAGVLQRDRQRAGQQQGVFQLFGL